MSELISPEDSEAIQIAQSALSNIRNKLFSRMAIASPENRTAMEHTVGIHACLITDASEALDQALRYVGKFEERFNSMGVEIEA
jgi:hypothetical protein